MMTLSLAALSGGSEFEKDGLSFAGETAAQKVQLLVDETWTDATGLRQVKQEIFESVFEMIDAAEAFILIHFFFIIYRNLF